LRFVRKVIKMKNSCLFKTLAILLFVCLLSPPCSWGQTDYRFQEDDLLKEMDKAAPKSSEQKGQEDDLLKEMDKAGEAAPQDQKGKEQVAQAEAKRPTELSKLVDNFHGSLRLRGMHYWQNPPERDGADTRNDFGNALFKFSDKTGYKDFTLNVGGWVEYGNEENTYSGTSFSEFWQDMDRRRRILDISDLYINYSRETFNFLIGKKTLTNGMSTLYLPSDRMRPQDLNDPMDVKDLNLWQARMDYDVAEATTLTAAFLPLYQPQKTPSETSRWMGERKKGDSTEFDLYDAGNANMKEDVPIFSDTNFGYFARFKKKGFHGWDLFASFYHGPNPFYVVREEQVAGPIPGTTKPQRIKEVVKVDDYAAGFSTTYESWEFHGEVVYNYSYDRKDDDYFNYVGGFTYTFDDFAKKLWLEKIEFTLEYANEIITRVQNAETYVSSSKQSRLGRNDILSRINFEYNNNLSFQFVCNFQVNQIDYGRFQRLEAKYKLRDGLITKLAGEFFGGQSDSLYGRWQKNDRLILEFEYSF